MHKALGWSAAEPQDKTHINSEPVERATAVWKETNVSKENQISNFFRPS
jgi:hypothetical protein